MDSSSVDNGPTEMSKLIILQNNNDEGIKSLEKMKTINEDIDIDHTFGEVGHGLILYKEN